MTTAVVRAPRSVIRGVGRLRPIRPIVLAGCAVLVVAASHVISVGNAPTSPSVTGDAATHAAVPVGPLPGAPTGSRATIAEIDHSLRAWTANLAANGRDFFSATNIAVLYDARGRLTGDVGDYGRAIEAVDRALTILPGHMPARVLHARLLQTTHDFSGALAEADAILRDDSTQSAALATAGDASLELGDVPTAARDLEELARTVPGAAVTARLARVAFIEGRVADSVGLAQRAYDESVAAGDDESSVGWYAYLAGTNLLATGDPSGAAAWMDRAVGHWPDSFLAIAGRARVAAALGDTAGAIDMYRRAIAIAPQPDSLAALGDLYALRGDAKAAAEQYATVEAIAHLATLNAYVYNRQVVLFSVNHGRDLATALDLATRELAVRKDVYGYDAYAWALLANGRTAEADAAMRTALSFGTRDALLFEHAGEIAAARGDGVRARTFLERALALAGALDPLTAARAQARLESVR